MLVMKFAILSDSSRIVVLRRISVILTLKHNTVAKYFPDFTTLWSYHFWLAILLQLLGFKAIMRIEFVDDLRK